MTNNLKKKEQDSVYIIREAEERFENPAIMWSMGKDSTVAVWLARKAFFGEVPFPVIYIDTGFHFPEMHEFRTQWGKKWNLEIVIAQNKEAVKNGMNHQEGTLKCCGALKTEALKQVVEKQGFDALILAIRRDEHGIRAKERIFSPRNKNFQWDYENQPPEVWNLYTGLSDDKTHMRVHPLLSWTEVDVWEYIKQENIPINPLYFAKEGKRYRSLGCIPCTEPINSEADTIEKIIEELKTTNKGERSGRQQDKENVMQKLRALGYM